MVEIGFVFPGQGSQYVGMGKGLMAFPLAAEVFDAAEHILGRDIKGLCLNGSEEELRETINTQTAIFVVSYICLGFLRNAGITADIVAGHSLGEYSALVASGVLGFEEGLTIVAERARLMQQAAENQQGAMIAVLGMQTADISDVVEDLKIEGIINIANYNCPDQTVVSGEKKLIEKARLTFEQMGAKRSVLLPVNGAFHTPMMRSAEARLNQYFKKVVLKDAKVLLASNSTAKISTDAVAIKEALSRQMTSSVLWQQSVEKMLEAGVKTFVEVGPGRVLSGLIRRIDKKTRVLNVEDEKSFINTRSIL